LNKGIHKAIAAKRQASASSGGSAHLRYRKDVPIPGGLYSRPGASSKGRDYSPSETSPAAQGKPLDHDGTVRTLEKEIKKHHSKEMMKKDSVDVLKNKIAEVKLKTEHARQQMLQMDAEDTGHDKHLGDQDE